MKGINRICCFNISSWNLSCSFFLVTWNYWSQWKQKYMERDTLLFSFVLDQDQRFIQVSILLPAATTMNKYIEKSTNRTRKHSTPPFSDQPHYLFSIQVTSWDRCDCVVCVSVYTHTPFSIYHSSISLSLSKIPAGKEDFGLWNLWHFISVWTWQDLRFSPYINYFDDRRKNTVNSNEQKSNLFYWFDECACT